LNQDFKSVVEGAVSLAINSAALATEVIREGANHEMQ